MADDFVSAFSSENDRVAFLSRDRMSGRFDEPSSKVLPALHVFSADTFAGREVPARRFLVKDLIPDLAVTLMGGDGGIGKSTLTSQLAIAVATGTDWVGTLPEFGPVLYVSAEDDRDELHQRFNDIVRGKGLELADLKQLHVLSLVGKDAVMAIPDGRGAISATPLWKALLAKISAIKPRLLVLDNLADVFSGNENVRSEARQFIGLLRNAAVDHGLAVVLISHPSLSGISSGTGTSGSTAWSNSVRSRLYLDRPKSDGDNAPDPDARVLRLMKANYAPTGIEIAMRWDRGCFQTEGHVGGIDRASLEAKADKSFLDLLARLTSQGRDVSPNLSVTYAPSVFAGLPNNGGFSKRVFTASMERLLGDNRIRIEKFGPPSKQRSRFVMAGDL